VKFWVGITGETQSLKSHASAKLDSYCKRCETKQFPGSGLVRVVTVVKLESHRGRSTERINSTELGRRRTMPRGSEEFTNDVGLSDSDASDEYLDIEGCSDEEPDVEEHRGRSVSNQVRMRQCG